MEPVVVIPVDHSVALDVREGDYYSINVKHAKTADSVESLPQLTTTSTDSDVVAFKIGDQSYSKRVTDVDSANVALKDKKGRDLTTLASQEEYVTLVDNYLAGKLLVQSVNGKTGNVTVNAKTVHLENVDNTSDLDKPISTATQEALDQKQNALSAGANIRLENDTISAVVDFSPLENRIKTVQEEVNSVETELENAVADCTVINADLQNQIDTHSTRISNAESNITTNTNDISNLKTRLEGVEQSIDSIDLSQFDSSDVVDQKIADAMAGEQVQDEDLANRIQEVRNNLDLEASTRESQISQLQADVVSSITNLRNEYKTDLDNYYSKSEVDAKISSITIPDVSDFITREEADSLYATITSLNAKIAELQSQIDSNVGLVNSSAQSENYRLWVEE